METQNYMIKPSNNSGLESVVDSVTSKALISDRPLRLFIPPQVCKTTPRLRHIWGYCLCIITKYMHIDLNVSRKNIVTYSKHNCVRIHTHNSSYITTSTAHYKNK